MKAVILAAGIGSRLAPLTDNKPKSLIDIGGETILGRMITNLINVNITDILIVTGYMEDQIKAFVAEKFSNLEIKFIRNDKYLTTNTAYSLTLAKDFALDSDFIKFDADVVFGQTVLEKLIHNPHKTCLCIDKNIHLDKEEVKVMVDEDDKVLKVGKKLDSMLAKGESIGIEKIGNKAGKILFEELTELLKDPNNNQEYYDDSYTTLVEKGIPFHAVDITGLKWVEVDTHQDLELAIKLFS